MKLILSSSDFGVPESARVIYDNLPKPVGECRVLYFPNECATAEKIAAGAYIPMLCSYGFAEENITVADYFSEGCTVEGDFDVVYVGGGNTFGIMKFIRDSRLDGVITDLVRGGAVYIGGSAGAHIATMDIGHALRYDRNTYGLTDFSGLGLHRGILMCHYCEERRQHYEMLCLGGRYPVTALSDTDSLVVEE